MKLSRKQLDALATTIGVIGGIATVLGTNGIIDANHAGAISGIATILLGIIIQKPAKKEKNYGQLGIHNDPY